MKWQGSSGRVCVCVCVVTVRENKYGGAVIMAKQSAVQFSLRLMRITTEY